MIMSGDRGGRGRETCIIGWDDNKMNPIEVKWSEWVVSSHCRIIRNVESFRSLSPR